MICSARSPDISLQVMLMILVWSSARSMSICFDSVSTRSYFFSFVMRIVSYVVAGLLAVLLILAIVLIIIQVRKPSFEGISIRAFISSDENQDTADEILSKCKPVPLDKFKKKKEVQ